MQSTGQTSTHALSFTLMHGSAMIYGIDSPYIETPIEVAALVRPPILVSEGARRVKNIAARTRHAHWVRRRGSSASRSESPKRLNANTARLIAKPGKIAIHGAVSANCTAAPRSIRPQAAVGSDTPRPRK